MSVLISSLHPAASWPGQTKLSMVWMGVGPGLCLEMLACPWVPCHPQVHPHLAAQALQKGTYSLGMSHLPRLTLLPQNSTHSLCPDEMTAKTKEREVLALEESIGLEEAAPPCSPAEPSEAAPRPGMQLSCAGEDLGWGQWGLAPPLCLDGCWRSRGGRRAEERACPQVSPSGSYPAWLRPRCAIRARQQLGQEPGAAPGELSSCVRGSGGISLPQEPKQRF